ncbi:MAG: fatty acid desaturase [Phycisphaeraceae bacterium]|nr:fatty acid desaturase [Phycisphaeraceae bacterium]
MTTTASRPAETLVRTPKVSPRDLPPDVFIDPETGGPSTVARKLALPEGVQPYTYRWHVIIAIALIHLAAIPAFLPQFFSWTGVALVPIGVYFFGCLGINLCYHRLLTHRGFVVPKWIEHAFAMLALCNLQGTPASWVAAHRRHHQHADHEPDPHSPLVHFLWGHILWLFVSNPHVDTKEGIEKYCVDLMRDPVYRSMENNRAWLLLYPLSALAIMAAGFGIGFWMTGTTAGAWQLSLSWLFWGVFVRTVVVWHITWSVNSITHMFGYRNYETGEDSRNNWLVAILSGGEGWHNNHHADQRSAAHGHKWWEIDPTYLTILFLRKTGIAKDLVQPRSWGQRKV